MRKIITFLGIKPSLATYEWNGQPYSGQVFAEAMYQFLQFDQMLVLTTQEATSKTWPLLKTLHNDPRIECLPIPDGKGAQEMWQIFESVIEKVDDGETVIFDITHGFRTLPFLVFLFAAFLKTAKKVTIEAVYYGALDMAAQNQGRAPVVNLSPFVTMLDWITATDQFLQSGNAQSLAKLMNPQVSAKGSLANASQTLEMISQAALLCQPFTLMQNAPTLFPALQAAEEEMAERARPFRVLNERINREFGQFQAKFPAEPENVLRSEFRLIEWYYENKQLIQAMSLAREFLVDCVQYRLSGELKPESFARGLRAEFEYAVSGLPKVGGPHPKEPREFSVDDLNLSGQIIHHTWAERDLLKKTWGALEVVRNGIDHAEHQKAPLPLHSIQKKAEKDVMPGLRALAQQWKLI